MYKEIEYQKNMAKKPIVQSFKIPNVSKKDMGLRPKYFNPLKTNQVQQEKKSVSKYYKTSASAQTNRSNIIQCYPAGIVEHTLNNIPHAFHRQIEDSCDEMAAIHPEINECFVHIRSAALKGGTIAQAGPLDHVEHGQHLLHSKLQLNTNFFNRDVNVVSNDLQNNKQRGFLATGDVKGTIKHELSHILQLRIDGLRNRQPLGGPFGIGYKYDWMNDTVPKIICDNAWANMGHRTPLNLGSDIPPLLSRYAATNYGECFAEAMAEHDSNRYRPWRRRSRFSKEVHKAYKEYRRANGV